MKKVELTASQEDYLEAILGLIRQTGNARVRDIAEKLKVAKSSVTIALRGLAKRNLVEYEPYQLISLTDQGKAVADKVLNRHMALTSFLRDVLDVDERIAEANACKIEHSVNDGIMRRISCFVEFMSSSKAPAKELPRFFREHCAMKRSNNECEGCSMAAKERYEEGMFEEGFGKMTTLADLVPGDKAKILKVGGAAVANRRLMEMGITRGTKLNIIRVAPLGDPVEVKVRGYSLSLRKREAENVEVEKIS